jgi:hypothetical protein
MNLAAVSFAGSSRTGGARWVQPIFEGAAMTVPFFFVAVLLSFDSAKSFQV